MVIIDTNVLSEMMRPQPKPQVIDWLSRQRATDVHTSAVTVAEVSFGLMRMPEGKKRNDLEARFQRVMKTGFGGRILAFDEAAAFEYGLIMSARYAEGRPMSVRDGEIAAIAKTKGATLATRNTRDFEGCGLELVDPFRD
jgi:predicted nucleic acid-binding protein